MTRDAKGRRRRGHAPGCETLEDRRLLAVSLAFDYSLDSTSGFFNDSSRRALLESTLNAIASRLGDTLASVASRSYTLQTDAGNRTVTTSSPANVIKVYAYGRSLGGDTSAQGGAFYTTGAPMRGQSANDYAPNLAYLMFDADGSTSWFFGATTAGLQNSGRSDFVTVARHEFLHSLGFIGQPTFQANMQGSSFVGANARAANGGAAVRMDGSHIDASITSVMNAETRTGTRLDLGDLEWAMLRDIGWSVAATPSGFERGFRLFTGGQGDGTARVKVIPSRGVYMMPLDVLAGDTLRLRTLDGSSAQERGVDSFLKVFDAAGAMVFFSDDTSTARGKEDVTHTFAVGGRYWVGAGTYAQNDFTFSRPSTAATGSTAYFLEATLTGRPSNKPSYIAEATRPVSLSSGSYTANSTLQEFSRDVYRIDAVAGATYTVTTRLPAAGGISGPAVAAIYDASGRRVSGSTARPYGSLTWVAPASGPYYVRVHGYAAEAQIPTRAEDDAVLDSGFESVTRDGMWSIAGERDGGSDYALTISRRLPGAASGPEPLYIDYGQDGLWRWAEADGWALINPGGPEGMAVAADGSLFTDYGQGGLWRRTAAGAWSQISTADPQAVAPGGDGSMYVDYGPNGLWVWTPAAGLRQIHGADPWNFSAGPAGELYVDYRQAGLWIWTASSGQLIQINHGGPEGMTVGADGTLYADYGGLGLWTRTAAGLWSKLNDADSQGVAVGPDGAAYIDFGANGHWIWSRAGGWVLLNQADPESSTVAADGWVYIDYGQNGLWRWSRSAGFKHVHNVDPLRIAVRAKAR